MRELIIDLDAVAAKFVAMNFKTQHDEPVTLELVTDGGTRPGVAALAWARTMMPPRLLMTWTRSASAMPSLSMS